MRSHQSAVLASQRREVSGALQTVSKATLDGQAHATRIVPLDIRPAISPIVSANRVTDVVQAQLNSVLDARRSGSSGTKIAKLVIQHQDSRVRPIAHLAQSLQDGKDARRNHINDSHSKHSVNLNKSDSIHSATLSVRLIHLDSDQSVGRIAPQESQRAWAYYVSMRERNARKTLKEYIRRSRLPYSLSSKCKKLSH